MRKFALFLCIIITNSLLAQKVFTIDTLNKHVADLPFDQEVYIKVKDVHKAIDSGSVFRLFVRGGELVDQVFLNKNTDEYGPIEVLSRSANYTYIKLPAMGPDLHYEVILNHKFRGKALDSLLSVFRKFANTSPDRFNAIKALRKRIEPPNTMGSNRTAIGRYWAASGTYTADFDNYFNTKIKADFKKAVDLSKTPSQAVSHLTEGNLRLANSKFKTIDKTFDAYSIYLSEWANSNDTNIFNGGSSLAMNSKVVKPYHLIKRINNLKSSIKVIDKLIASTYQVLLLDGPNSVIYGNMIDDLKNIKSQLSTNKSFLNKRIVAITTALDDEKNMRYTTWFSATNEVRDLETKGSYIMIPNIGVAGLITPNGESDFIKPYVGVSFHLRQVNKKIPMRELKNTILHRLAIQVGLTVAETNDPNKEYFDLTNKMSLLTGINFKINHSFGISGGAVIMKRADPNPLKSKQHTVANGYIALTIDVDFAKSLKSLTGKFGL